MDAFIISSYRSGQPTEVEGIFRGFKWSFWAKYGQWEFSLSENPQIEPEWLQGCFAKNGNFEGHEIEPDAALRVIRDCLNAYANEHPAKNPRP